jgi:Fur family transcriptional regulator, ferric uptake regulator
MSAEEILGKLQTRTRVTNISTVYRTLDLLWKEGFALRNDLGENKLVFLIKEHGPHIHLVCRRCNLVIESNPDFLASLEEALYTEHGFNADLEHITIFGLCTDCNL